MLTSIPEYYVQSSIAAASRIPPATLGVWAREEGVKDMSRLDKLKLVGAAGFEPTTSLEFIQGALTAELYAYALFSTSDRRYPTNHMRSKNLGQRQWQLFPQCNGRLELRIHGAHVGYFFGTD